MVNTINWRKGKKDCYPKGFKVHPHGAPIVGYHGIEFHLLCKVEEKYFAIIYISPMALF